MQTSAVSAALSVLGLSVPALLSGCAEVGDREAASSRVATELLTAVAGKDGHDGLRAARPGHRQGARAVRREPCDQAILDENLPASATIKGIDVYGQWAQVRLTGDTVFLAVFPGGWRVVAAGCEARESRPYDCVLQGG